MQLQQQNGTISQHIEDVPERGVGPVTTGRESRRAVIGVAVRAAVA
jgi:hypothetical protein